MKREYRRLDVSEVERPRGLKEKNSRVKGFQGGGAPKKSRVGGSVLLSVAQYISREETIDLAPGEEHEAAHDHEQSGWWPDTECENSGSLKKALGIVSSRPIWSDTQPRSIVSEA